MISGPLSYRVFRETGPRPAPEGFTRMGGINSTKNFQKFRSKTEWIGSIQPEKFRKKSVYLLTWNSSFSQLDRGRNGPFHSTFPTHSQSQYSSSLFGMSNVQHGGKHLRIVNSGSIGGTRTSMCTYNRSVAASQAR